MIERKRGHIVTISSFVARITIPRSVAYSTSKWSQRGFMSALYDELCFDKHDEYINQTIVYPIFINTRKELSDAIAWYNCIYFIKLPVLNELYLFFSINAPRIKSTDAADRIVKGIMFNEISLVVPEYFTHVEDLLALVRIQIFHLICKLNKVLILDFGQTILLHGVRFLSTVIPQKR